MCTLLVCWLYLHAGLSRSRTNQVLKAMKLILTVVIRLCSVVLAAAGIPLDLSEIPIPKDIRTVVGSIGLDPDLVRTICCPKCFSLYPQTGPIPNICTWSLSPGANACNTPLWKFRRTRKGKVRVPRRFYTTQSFESWLKFFLGRPEIEDLIDKSYRHIPNPKMRGIWDSPAWQSLGEFRYEAGNLTFGLYIDWFNPLTMKIAGMSPAKHSL